MPFGGADVAPGNHEHRMALLHGIAHKGVLGPQVQDIELVDARRHHDEGPRAHLRRDRAVLDQLHQVVLVNHVARRQGEAGADLEGRFVALPDASPVRIRDQVRDPPGDALAPGLERLLQRRGVGGREIRRAHGIAPLLHRKPQPVLGPGLQIRALGKIGEKARSQQVGLLQIRVIRVIAPIRGREAAVPRLGRNLKLARP